MKKFIILSFASLLLTSTIVADEKEKSTKVENISDNVLRQFSYNFYRATDVKWAITNNYQKASFNLNGKASYAIFDLQNQFLVATQLEEFANLPIEAQQVIKQKFVNCKAISIVKVISRPSDYQFNDDTDSYWVSLLHNNQQIILLVSPNAEVNIVKTNKLS